MNCPNCRSEFSTDGHFCPRCGTKVEAPGDGGLSATRSIAAPEGRHHPGHLVGNRYKLLSTAGSGGMGVVFKAEDTKLRRTVALKFLPAEISADPQAKMRFLREAQQPPASTTPTSARFMRSTRPGREMFLTWPSSKAGALRNGSKRAPCPSSTVLNDLCPGRQGLKAAHERGVVHRDVKPANIMLTARARSASRTSAWPRSRGEPS